MIRWCVAFALPFSFAFALTEPARAEGALVTEGENCAVFQAPLCPEGAALRDAVALELRAQNISLVQPPGICPNASSSLVIEVSQCSGEAIALRVRQGDQSRDRNLLLSDIPERTRARVVALVLAELVEVTLATQTEPSAAPAEVEAAPAASLALSKPPNPIRERPPVTAPAPLAPSRPAEARLALAPEARLFVFGDPLFGGRISTEVARYSFGASLLANRKDAAIGDVLGIVFHAVFGVRAISTDMGSRGRFEAGARLGAGLVSVDGLAGSAAQGEGATEPYLDGALTLGAHRKFGANWSGGVNLELGYARGVVALADGGEASTFGGVFVGALLSVQAPL